MALLGLYFRTWKRAMLIVKSKYLKGLLEHAQVYVPPNEQRQQQAAGARRQSGVPRRRQQQEVPCEAAVEPEQVQQACNQAHCWT